MRATRPASCAGADRRGGDVLFLALRRAASSPITQLAHSLALPRTAPPARGRRPSRGGGERPGVVGGEAVVALEARLHGFGQLRQGGLHRIDPGRRNLQRQQVGVGEVAVVVGVFLGAHGAGLAGVRIEQHGGLVDAAAVLDRLDLPLRLVLDRLLQEAEGVEVLDLAPRAQRVRTLRRTETLASQRKEPSCMLPSQMSIQRTRACSALA
jgi:hypothetical protein